MRMTARIDAPRVVLASLAALLAALGALAAALDLDLLPLGVPVAIVLGFEAIVDAAFVLAPPRGPWSDDHRSLAGVVTIMWLVSVPLVLLLASVATACACASSHAPRLLLGIMPFDWAMTAAIASPVLLGLTRVLDFLSRFGGPPA